MGMAFYLLPLHCSVCGACMCLNGRVMGIQDWLMVFGKKKHTKCMMACF